MNRPGCAGAVSRFESYNLSISLFAQDSFWKWPSFWDLAGFFIGVSSIWLSWFFARRDLRERIEAAKFEARREAVRAARILILVGYKSNLEEIRHALELCEEAQKGDRFDRAVEFATTAEMRLIRMASADVLAPFSPIPIAKSQDDVRFLLNALSNKKRKTPGRLTEREKGLLRSVFNRMIQVATNLEREIAGGAHGE